MTFSSLYQDICVCVSVLIVDSAFVHFNTFLILLLMNSKSLVKNDVKLVM